MGLITLQVQEYIIFIYLFIIILCICVTLTPYIKGPPGTLYHIKFLHMGIYLSARPLTLKNYDRCTLLRKLSLLLGNGDINYINHAQILYITKISPSCTMHPHVSCYLLGMIYVIRNIMQISKINSYSNCGIQ